MSVEREFRLATQPGYTSPLPGCSPEPTCDFTSE